uniref:Uncharacterized protein n=1 Tax=Glossina austeni TaxID=7395 RepID=A0A1A9UP61_GLOAU
MVQCCVDRVPAKVLLIFAKLYILEFGLISFLLLEADIAGTSKCAVTPFFCLYTVRKSIKSAGLSTITKASSMGVMKSIKYEFYSDLQSPVLSYHIIIPKPTFLSESIELPKPLLRNDVGTSLRQSVTTLRLKTQIFCKQLDLEPNNSVLQSYEEQNYNDLHRLTSYQTPDLQPVTRNL